MDFYQSLNMMVQNTDHKIKNSFTSISFVSSRTSGVPPEFSFFSSKDVITEEILVSVSLSRTGMKIFG